LSRTAFVEGEKRKAGRKIRLIAKTILSLRQQASITERSLPKRKNARGCDVVREGGFEPPKAYAIGS